MNHKTKRKRYKCEKRTCKENGNGQGKEGDGSSGKTNQNALYICMKLLKKMFNDKTKVEKRFIYQLLESLDTGPIK